jgi:hypothetical protein
MYSVQHLRVVQCFKPDPLIQHDGNRGGKAVPSGLLQWLRADALSTMKDVSSLLIVIGIAITCA